MVTAATSHLDPPKSWEEFEEICADLFGREWQDNQTTRYGRQGQRQNGVDIYGRPGGKRYAGVQCKGRSKWPPDTLKTSDIDKEVAKAKKFRPKLNELVIATVDPNDISIQDHVRKITGKHEQQGLFSVHVAAWPEIVRRLTQYDDLINKHYGYVSNAQIQQSLQSLPDLIAHAVREQLPGYNTSERIVPQSNNSPEDSAVADALERDLNALYENAVRRSFFPEAGSHDEYQILADRALSKQYAITSEALRRRIILRASRSASLRGLIDRARQTLSAAQRLSGPDSDAPACARLANAEGAVDKAISILRDQKDSDGRSTLLHILLSSRGAASALQWFTEEKLTIRDLTANGVHTLCFCYLDQGDIDAVRNALSNVTSDQLHEAPYLLYLRAAANLASVLTLPERELPLNGLPLEVTRARLALPAEIAASRLDLAIADLNALIPIVLALGLRETKGILDFYLTWCELLHPRHQSLALERLRREMTDPGVALVRLQLAFAYDPDFNPQDVASYLARREKLGGLDRSELRAMLVLQLHSSNASAIAKLIAHYRSSLEEIFPPIAIASIEIQALAKSGEITSARRLLETNRPNFEVDAISGLEAEIAKADGADPVEQDLRHYQATGTVEALRSLLISVGRKRDHRAVAKYSEELFERTNDPQDITNAAQAFANLDDGPELIRIIDAHPSIADRDADLARAYGWNLFQIGRLKDAKAVAELLGRQAPNSRDLDLELAVAIETGEWETLVDPLSAFLRSQDNYSASDLMRAAHLAQASGRGPMMELLKAAIAKKNVDAEVWLGAYTIAIEEGLESEIPEAHEWFKNALSLSGEDGPIQRFELKELLPQQKQWNERSRSISDSIARGELPLIIAATGLRTTIVDILLRNLIRNSDTFDPRKRVVLPLYSGSRRTEPCGHQERLAFDMSALLVMGWLGILPLAISAFPKIVLPATILAELFEGRRRIQQMQKSRIRNATRLEGIVARGRLKLVRNDDYLSDGLSREAGKEFASLVRAAEAVDGVVLRPAPVHKPGLEQIPADVASFTKSLADMKALLGVLVERGAIDESVERTARDYFELQDSGWDTSAIPDPDRPLFVDGLALSYIQYVGLLDAILNVFPDVRIEASALDEALIIIDHQKHVAEVLDCIDTIRVTVREANAAGKVVFGPRRPYRGEAHESYSASTLHLLTNLSDADAVVCDDRALNKEQFAQDSSGRRVPTLTSLDVIEELRRRELITDDTRRSLRHRLRLAAVSLLPADVHEIANSALRSKTMKSAEFKAVEDSIDLSLFAQVPSFPHELTWLGGLSIAAKSAIFEAWKLEPNKERAASAADMILDLIPLPSSWISRWGKEPPLNWAASVRSAFTMGLAMPVELGNSDGVNAYKIWFEERVLETMRTNEPEFYEIVVTRIREIILSSGKGGDGQETA